MKYSATSPAATAKSGLSTIAGIALVGRQEVIKGSLIKLDAQIFIGTKETECIIGSVRFYNEDKIYFSDDAEAFMLYYIDTTVELFLFFLSLCIHFHTQVHPRSPRQRQWSYR